MPAFAKAGTMGTMGTMSMGGFGAAMPPASRPESGIAGDDVGGHDDDLLDGIDDGLFDDEELEDAVSLSLVPLFFCIISTV